MMPSFIARYFRRYADYYADILFAAASMLPQLFFFLPFFTLVFIAVSLFLHCLLRLALFDISSLPIYCPSLRRRFSPLYFS